MNRNLVRTTCLVLVLLGATFASGTQASSQKGGARLIVQRAPNFGTDLFVRLSIDGKKVADIPRNQHYGGTISAGRHVLSVLALPNRGGRRPTSMPLTVQSGRTYIFTATWQEDHAVLKPSDFYSPTTAVPAAR